MIASANLYGAHEIATLPTMEREKVDQRILFMTRRSQLEAVDRWRTKQRPIPSRNEALRRILTVGLEALGEHEGDSDAE